MKASIVLVLIFLVFDKSSFAQNCNCPQEFQYVKEKIEQNYAGYRDKINPKTLSKYQKYTQQLMNRSKDIVYTPQCISLISEWLKFFKDGHVEIGRNRMSKEKYIADQDKLIKSIEKISIPDFKLGALESAKSIEGIYWNTDSTLKIAVIRNKTSFRDYAGVVLASKNSSWKPGAVNLELKLQQDTLKGIEFDKYYTPTLTALKVTPNALGNWQRAGTVKSKIEKIDYVDVSGKVLSDQTFYMKIGTFNQRNAKNIDSMVQANKTILEKTPNLILDLRNNGGGADFSYQPLMPYLYTNPIKEIGTNILSSEDNIAGWKALLNMNDIPEKQKVFIRDKVTLMEQHKGEFVKMGEDNEITIDHPSLFPKKIVVLINKGCGSTTEQFLLTAKQSKKVVLMGIASAGVLDYANVRDIGFSCMPYALHYPTSRSRRVDMDQGIDNIGIKPDVELNETQNWVIKAQQFLEQ